VFGRYISGGDYLDDRRLCTSKYESATYLSKLGLYLELYRGAWNQAKVLDSIKLLKLTAWKMYWQIMVVWYVEKTHQK
jgi:hypothetical protein